MPLGGAFLLGMMFELQGIRISPCPQSATLPETYPSVLNCQLNIIIKINKEVKKNRRLLCNHIHTNCKVKYF